MLDNNAAIKLGSDYFQIDRAVDNHYVHRFRDIKPSRLEITGMPGKSQLDGSSIMWTFDDWSGGEGNRIYYADQPTVYSVGYELNPRVKGQITGRPNRGRVTITANKTAQRPMMTMGDGAVWIGGGQVLAYSRGAPATWTEKSAAEVGLNGHANYQMTALTGDHEWVYLSGYHSASSGTRLTLQVSRSDTGSPNIVVAEATGKAPYADMAVLEGKLYAWTGRKLWEHDLDGTFPLTVAADTIRLADDTGVDPVSANVFSTDWWAECKATENSIIYWYSTEGQTEVYEFKKGQGKPIWRPPYGFTVKGSVYQNGVMFFSGHWGGDSVLNGWAAVYALPLDSYRPIALKTPRRLQNTFANGAQLQEMAASYGHQVMTANQKYGQIFIFDMETDGLTMLDDLTRETGADPDSLTFVFDTNRIGQLITVGPYRYVSVYAPGTAGAGTYQIVYYKDDEPGQRETGQNTTNYTGQVGYWESPKWDMDYPMEQKNLIGFHLTFEPLVSGMFLDVSYSIDGGAFTALTQITSATSGASAGRVFIPVATISSQKKFFQMQYRVTMTSSTAVKTPILYAITAESKLTRKREEWELVIRLKDEQSRTRPSDRKVKGPTLRDWLETTVKSGNVVTFQDGFRYQNANQYTTSIVTIEEMTDVVMEPGEGSCRLVLVANTEAT